MLKPRRPSAALVVACLALAVSLSGVGYAAITIPRNSVGTPQLKNNAVNSKKVLDNSIKGADVKESSLTGIVKTGSAAGGALTGTYPDPTIPANSVTGAQINETTLDVIQGRGSSGVQGFAQLQNSLVFVDALSIPGSGFIQATCNAAGTAATFRYRDTSGGLTYVWVDTGVDQPANLVANPNGTSVATVTSTAFDVMTWFVRPGATPFNWTTVQLAKSNEAGFCTYFKLAQTVHQ